MKNRLFFFAVIGVTIVLWGCIKTPSVKSPMAAPASELLDACRKGDSSACQWAGNRYYYGQNASVDYQLAEECYQRACTGDPKLGCKGLYEVGYEYLSGKKVAKNPAKARQLFQLPCTQEHGPACTSLANLYAKGKGSRWIPPMQMVSTLKGAKQRQAARKGAGRRVTAFVIVTRKRPRDFTLKAVTGKMPMPAMGLAGSITMVPA